MPTFLLQSSPYWYNGSTYAKDQDGTPSFTNNQEAQARSYAFPITTPLFVTAFITHPMLPNPLRQQADGDGIFSSDQVKPVISGLSPAIGVVLSKTTKLQFDVTDNTGLRRVVLVASFTGVDGKELIHDGEAFNVALYSNSDNTREAIANGFRYTIRRDGGWPGNITLYPLAVDTAGNQNS